MLETRDRQLRGLRALYQQPGRSFIVSFAFVLSLAASGAGPLVGHAAGASDPDLQLHWNLDEGSGTTATDASGHGNPGTLFHSPTYTTGNTGQGVSLNGVNQYIQSADPLASLGTVDEPYALSAWVKVPTGVTNGNIVHISSNADGSGWCIPVLRLEGGVFSATGWDGGEVSAVGSTPVVAGTWYQVMTTWDPTNGLRLFVNGNLEQATPQANYAANGAPVYFSMGLSNAGCSEDQGYLKATVDDVRVYSRALDADDIESIATSDDNDGASAADEDAAPNGGDANHDGTADSQQSNVASFVDSQTHKYISVEAPNACSLSGLSTTAASANTAADASYTYPAGFAGYTTDCGTAGYTATITMYFYGVAGQSMVLRKYNPTTKTYTTVDGAVISQVTIGGQAATKVTYQVTDGSALDSDGTANGTIVDPVGLAQAAATLTDTGVNSIFSMSGAAVLLLAAVVTRRGLLPSRK